MGYIVSLMIAVYVLVISTLIIATNNETTALRTQCENTASTLEAKEYNFDNSHNRCNIVTQNGRLVTF